MTPLSPSEAITALTIAGAYNTVDHPRVIVVVDTERDAATGIASDLAGLASAPVVVIAISDRTPEWADVVVPDTDAATPLVTAIERNPLASLVLTQQLRLAEQLPAPDAAVAESLAYATLQGCREFAAWLATQGRRVRPDFAEPAVLVHDHGDDDVVVELNRPKLRNALTAQMRDELAEVLRTLALRPTVPIVIRGAGSSFCVGGDLAEFGSIEHTAHAHHIRQMSGLVPAMIAVAHRCTVHLHGACVGAGIELAAFAHHVTAAPDTVISLPEVSMGLIPGAGGTVSLSARLGRHGAAALLLRGQPITAAEALALGLIDEIRG